MQEVSTNPIFFYSLSFILILTSLASIFLPKISYSLRSLFIYFITLGVLFFCLKSFLAGALHILIFAVLLIALLYILISKTNIKDKKTDILYKKSPSFWLAILGFFLVIIAGIFILKYFSDAIGFKNMIIFSDKNSYTKLASAFLTVKSIIKDFFLSFILTISIIILSVTGILNILISRTDKKEEN